MYLFSTLFLDLFSYKSGGMNGGNCRENGKGVNHIRTFPGVTLSSAPSDPTPRSRVLLLRNPAPRHMPAC